MELIVNITDEEYAVLESWLGVGMVEPWLQHALDNKIRQRVDATILEVTEFNPQKLNQGEKLLKLVGVKLPTRKERDGILPND
jgi:hypothetical protein